ncbi:MAG: DUF523 domain-containing protein [Lachnospiraceae bacterium]|jgi:uncharacterized protein YbbK (DUF523 family)|nr:DUF523 domain-containing protein [Lachnospiraceae bacterium]
MIIVSACLAGINCNYEGGNKGNSKIVEMVNKGQAIPVCPEQLGGLITPRCPAEIKNGRLITKNNVDVTAEFQKGAEEVLNICKKYNCKKAILKSKSPSCGCGAIFNGEFTGTLIKGDGITTRLLKENHIEVISSDDI